jgi:hypothetical protein
LSVQSLLLLRYKKSPNSSRGFFKENDGIGPRSHQCLDFQMPSGTKEWMKRRNSRRIGLGFQWNASSWDSVGLLSDSLFARIASHSIHWILPAFPPNEVRKPSTLVRFLVSRVSAGTDRVIARGYAGACHPLLNLDELEREISWGVRNQWGTGIADILKCRPSILAPPVPDLLRPGAWAAYRQHGFGLIGICPEPSPPPPTGPQGCFFYSKVDAAAVGEGTPAAKRLRRLLSAGGDSLLVLDLSGAVDRARFAYVLDELSATVLAAECRLALLPAMGDLPAAAPVPSGWRLDWTAFPIPRLNAGLDAAAAIARKKRKKSDEYVSLLQRMAPLGAPTAVPLQAPSAVPLQAPSTAPPAAPHGRLPASGRTGQGEALKRQRLVAVMQGEVTLAGSAFDVRLAGGRFAGAMRRGRDLLPRLPAQSYVRVQGAASCLRTLSSFSFESETGTGLREELGIDGRDGAVVCIEYSFRDDSPVLSISLELRMPDFGPGARIEEYAPLSIALRDLSRKEAITVESAAPDDSRASVVLSSGSDWVFMPGAMHRVRRSDGGWIVLRYSSPGGRRWGVPFFRVVRTRGRRTLEVNPFGSYAPVSGAELSGCRSTYTLLLGLEDS